MCTHMSEYPHTCAYTKKHVHVHIPHTHTHRGRAELEPGVKLIKSFEKIPPTTIELFFSVVLYPKTVHRITSACYSGSPWFVLKPCVASHMRCSAESSRTLWVQLSECRGSCKTALRSCCLHKHASCVPTVGSRTPKVLQLFYPIEHMMLIGGGGGFLRVRISERRVDNLKGAGEASNYLWWERLWTMSRCL